MNSVKNDALLAGPVKESRFPGQRPCQLFSDLAKSHPNAIALIWEDEETFNRHQMTMEQLERKSNQLARGILRHCSQLVAPNNDGDRVIVICIPPSWKLICTILAIWKTGACYLPIELPSSRDSVKHLLEEAKPFLIIDDWEEEDLFPEVNKISWSSLEDISIGLSERPLTCEEHYPIRSDPTEIILYTSGSTDLPKGVRIRSSSILNRLEWQWRCFPFGNEEETNCFRSSITFFDSVAEVWAPLLNPEHPLPILILSRSARFNPQLLVPILNKYKVGRIILVPKLLNSILTHLKNTNDNTSLRQLKLWICGSETLPCSLAEDFFDWSETNGGTHILCNSYGRTETMGAVIYHVMKTKHDIQVKGKVPIGGPVDNTAVYLLDEQMRPVNSGKIGNLYVAGKQVAKSYVNGRDPILFIENTYTADPEYKILFRTGDYASVHKETILFEGRNDSQVKLRGKIVDMNEVETALNKLQTVQESVVLCYRTDQADQELVAFVKLNEGVLAESNDIQKLLLKSLPSYAVPQVTIIDEMPLRVNGKVDRKHLLHRCNQIAVDKKRRAIGCLWTVLSSVMPHAIPKLSLESNFYSLGGDSQNTIVVIEKLSEEGYNINVADFISSETILDLVNKMTPKTNGNKGYNKTSSNKYKFDQISEKYKADIYRIITDSYYNKSCIEMGMEPPVEKHEYIQLLDAVWPKLINNPLSFVIKDINTDEVVGCKILMDIIDDQPVRLKSNYDYVIELLESLEEPLKKTLPKGKILYCDMFATKMKLTPQENVELALEGAWHLEDIARQNGFTGIFTTNSNPLTKQLSEIVLDFKQLKSYQMNQFVASDGTRPFKKADNSVIITCSFKELY
ncbi:unnamed protein product [Nezara viridula]|uniref:Carrier domain-containing protein n=1 Tax=Nezara viridula TaxID=85310 RepID=A0A9P0E9C8_NEZVI|nr:unnamed protein product [Nezara viridula]